VGRLVPSGVLTQQLYLKLASEMTRQNRIYCASALIVFIGIAVLLGILTDFPGAFLWGSRTAGAADRGTDELHSLIMKSGGRPADEDLLRIESKYPRARTAALARFLRGYQHFTGKDYDAAIAAFDPSSAVASRIGDYTLYYRAQSEAAAGRPGDAIRDYKALPARFPESLMRHDSIIEAARASIGIGDPQGAIKLLSRMADESDADALLVTAQAYEAARNNPQAIELYRRVYYGNPATPAAEQAAEGLAGLGVGVADHPGTADQIQSRADSLFKANQYAEALKAYDDLERLYPGAGASEEITLRRGICQLNSRQPGEAARTLGQVSQKEPKLQGEALYYEAEAYRKGGQLSESAAAVDRLVSKYPDKNLAAAAVYNMAQYLDKRGRAAEAASRYRQIAGTFPRSEYAPEATYALGWKAYSDRRYSEAARILEQHLASYRYPASKFMGQAGFWAGKAEERLGNPRRALALYGYVAERYRFGYDGYVAARRVESLRSTVPGLKAEDAAAGTQLELIRQNLTEVQAIAETADGSEADWVNRADDLEVIGLIDMAIREINTAVEKSPSSPRLNLRLAQIYFVRGENLQATIVLRRAYPDLFSYKDSDLPRDAWEIFFPLSNWDLIKQEARRYGIDPYIVAGLIRQESVFNPNAISRVGARGLMQLMPSTGQLIAKRDGTGIISAGDLYNPSMNIKLGMNYLAQLIGQFGKIEYAAAAYNAGPGRARQWIAERGSTDMDEWVESIPFSETRGYVQSVLRNSANYRRLYSQ
jgi:soluble lytic murein transglycosylase